MMGGQHIVELLVIEQLLNMLPSRVRHWLVCWRLEHLQDFQELWENFIALDIQVGLGCVEARRTPCQCRRSHRIRGLAVDWPKDFEKWGGGGLNPAPTGKPGSVRKSGRPMALRADLVLGNSQSTTRVKSGLPSLTVGAQYPWSVSRCREAYQ